MDRPSFFCFKYFNGFSKPHMGRVIVFLCFFYAAVESRMGSRRTSIVTPHVADAIPVFLNASAPENAVVFTFGMPSHLGLSPEWNLENPVTL